MKFGIYNFKNLYRDKLSKIQGFIKRFHNTWLNLIVINMDKIDSPLNRNFYNLIRVRDKKYFTSSLLNPQEDTDIQVYNKNNKKLKIKIIIKNKVIFKGNKFPTFYEV
jgi:hypothetical protein